MRAPRWWPWLVEWWSAETAATAMYRAQSTFAVYAFRDARAAPGAEAMSGRFRRRDAEVEAFRFRLDDIPDWFMDKVSANEIITQPTHCVIETQSGRIEVDSGEWVVRDADGLLSVCRPDDFAVTYVALEPTP